MRSYNGFSPARRMEADAWLKAGVAAGRLEPPSRCMACGETRGIIDYHAEDYSQPFTAEKLAAIPLCFRCHMMLHARFRNPARWRRYIEQLEAGAMYRPLMSRGEIGEINRPGWVDAPIDIGPPRGTLAFFRSLVTSRARDSRQPMLFEI